jgi:hypothetical protein
MLSGGNLQPAVLARGTRRRSRGADRRQSLFDFAAVVSEDLDELLELSDRRVVMLHGEFVHEARASEADLTEIGRHMAGH